MFVGSFFEEVGEALLHALGPEGLVSLGIVALVVLFTVWMFARGDGLRVEVEPGPSGIDVKADEARFFVPWERVVEVTSRQSVEPFEDAPELTFDVEGAPAARLFVRFETVEMRDGLAQQVDRLRRRIVGPGPFRQPAHDH